MALTFRISNILTVVSGEDLLKNLTDISPQVSAVSIEASGENNICLRSIAPSPFGPMKEQVAIVTFNPVPSFLQEATHGSQQLQIRMMSGNTSSFWQTLTLTLLALRHSMIYQAMHLLSKLLYILY